MAFGYTCSVAFEAVFLEIDETWNERVDVDGFDEVDFSDTNIV